MGANMNAFNLETDFNVICVALPKLDLSSMYFVHKVLRKYLMDHNLGQVLEPNFEF